jgi:hypothetical protein
MKMERVYISGHAHRFCGGGGLLKDLTKYSISNTVVMPVGSDKDLLDKAEVVCRNNIDYMAHALGIHVSCPRRVVGAPVWCASSTAGLIEYSLCVEFRLEVYIHGFDALMSENGTVSPPEPDEDPDV